MTDTLAVLIIEELQAKWTRLQTTVVPVMYVGGNELSGVKPGKWIYVQWQKWELTMST